MRGAVGPYCTHSGLQHKAVLVLFFLLFKVGDAPHDDSNISPEFSYYFMGKIAALMPGVAGKIPTSP